MYNSSIGDRTTLPRRTRSSVGSSKSKVLAGQEDHFVPFEQVKSTQEALTSVRSVTTEIQDQQSGARNIVKRELTPWHADLSDWLLERFELRSKSSLCISSFAPSEKSPHDDDTIEGRAGFSE
jgi:hypothetical protein